MDPSVTPVQMLAVYLQSVNPKQPIRQDMYQIQSQQQIHGGMHGEGRQLMVLQLSALQVPCDLVSNSGPS